MKDVPLVEWARKLIDDQLERLSELRNANPRDPGFKLWRQTTLTIIQRIWPGDLERCERSQASRAAGARPAAARAAATDPSLGASAAPRHAGIRRRAGTERSRAPSRPARSAGRPGHAAEPSAARTERPGRVLLGHSGSG